MNYHQFKFVVGNLWTAWYTDTLVKFFAAREWWSARGGWTRSGCGKPVFPQPSTGEEQNVGPGWGLWSGSPWPKWPATSGEEYSRRHIGSTATPVIRLISGLRLVHRWNEWSWPANGHYSSFALGCPKMAYYFTRGRSYCCLNFHSMDLNYIMSRIKMKQFSSEHRTLMIVVCLHHCCNIICKIQSNSILTQKIAFESSSMEKYIFWWCLCDAYWQMRLFVRVKVFHQKWLPIYGKLCWLLLDRVYWKGENGSRKLRRQMKKAWGRCMLRRKSTTSTRLSFSRRMAEMSTLSGRIAIPVTSRSTVLRLNVSTINFLVLQGATYHFLLFFDMFACNFSFVF